MANVEHVFVYIYVCNIAVAQKMCTFNPLLARIESQRNGKTEK